MSSQIDGFIKGILLGGAIGAVLGILYAPKSGRETRDDIGRKSEELVAKAKEEYEAAVKNTGKAYDAAVRQLQQLESAAKKRVQKMEEKVEALVQ